MGAHSSAEKNQKPAPTIGEFVVDRVEERRFQYHRWCPMDRLAGPWLSQHPVGLLSRRLARLDHTFRVKEAKETWAAAHGPPEPSVWRDRQWETANINPHGDESEFETYSVQCDQNGEVRPGTTPLLISERNLTSGESWPVNVGYMRCAYPVYYGGHPATCFLFGVGVDGKPLSSK